MINDRTIVKEGYIHSCTSNHVVYDRDHLRNEDGCGATESCAPNPLINKRKTKMRFVVTFSLATRFFL